MSRKRLWRRVSGKNCSVHHLVHLIIPLILCGGPLGCWPWPSRRSHSCSGYVVPGLRGRPRTCVRAFLARKRWIHSPTPSLIHARAHLRGSLHALLQTYAYGGSAVEEQAEGMGTREGDEGEDVGGKGWWNDKAAGEIFQAEVTDPYMTRSGYGSRCSAPETSTGAWENAQTGGPHFGHHQAGSTHQHAQHRHRRAQIPATRSAQGPHIPPRNHFPTFDSDSGAAEVATLDAYKHGMEGMLIV